MTKSHFDGFGDSFDSFHWHQRARDRRLAKLEQERTDGEATWPIDEDIDFGPEDCDDIDDSGDA